MLSNFYRDAEHEILLDNEELAAAGPGVWYVSVHNGAENDAPLKYAISSLFETELECPAAHGTTRACDGRGSCRGALGRCDCDDGRVMDDCSGRGVFALDPNGGEATPPETAPAIDVDGWAFWSVPVGCDARKLSVTFNTEDSGARPFLVVRRGRLPLMIQGTFDYFDYYDEHKSSQKIVVTSCADESYGCLGPGCCMNPTYPGTSAERTSSRLVLALLRSSRGRRRRRENRQKRRSRGRDMVASGRYGVFDGRAEAGRVLRRRLQ